MQARRLMLHRRATGLATAGLIGAAATALSYRLPLAGAPVIALALGFLWAVLREPPAHLEPGLQFASRYLLQAAIVLLGATLSLRRVAAVGQSTLPVMLVSLGAALATAALAARFLGVPPRLATLLGVGTGICGASAIGAVSTVIGATGAELAYAMSTVFALNLVAVVVFPALGHAFHLSQPAFGVWAGTAVNDTSSVVAVAYTFGHEAGTTAIIVKLARTTMIVPITIVLAAFLARRGKAQGRDVVWRNVIPWFLLLFVVATILRSAGMIPLGLRGGIQQTALVLLACALAAVGLSIRVRTLAKTGFRPFLLGSLVWIAVSVTSLVTQRLFTGVW